MDELWLYFLAVFAVVLLPGMDMAYVLAASVSAGARGAVGAVAGITTAGVIHVAVGATGIAALLAVFPVLSNVMLAAGTAYLLWIGWSIFRGGGVDLAAGEAAADARVIYRRAVMTALLNPKAYAFMLAIFPAFLKSEARPLALQAAVLSLITAATQVAVYGSVAALAVRARRFMASHRQPISRALGALLMGAALATATQAWSFSDTGIREPALDNAPPSVFAGEKPGRDDFDFLVGTWDTTQTRSVKPLEDDAPWETFQATLTMKKLPGNLGNLDALVAPAWRPGWTGVTLRVFNGETGLWSIFWMAGKAGGVDGRTGNLQQPVVGRFAGNVGNFECDEVIDGVALRTQYRWTRVDAAHVRWQQAFSFDGGKTWKVNWRMEGRRVR